MTDKYMVIKYFDADRPNEIMKRGLTLEQARAFVSSYKGQGTGWKAAFTKED
jgi:hypothetical protein